MYFYFLVLTGESSIVIIIKSFGIDNPKTALTHFAQLEPSAAAHLKRSYSLMLTFVNMTSANSSCSISKADREVLILGYRRVSQRVSIIRLSRSEASALAYSDYDALT